MSKKKLSVFNRLSVALNGQATPKKVPTSVNSYTSNPQLFKGKSKEEYEAIKLQSKQNKYLGNMWKRVDSEMYQQSIYYETTRMASYTDFESMEFFPEIAAALDIMAEESSTLNEKGEILNIFSENERIKNILTDLFVNRLQIHTSLPAWTRNLCKYGDNFVFLNIDSSDGVMGNRQLPNYEMERHEGDLYNMLLAKNQTAEVSDDKSNNQLRFIWRTKNIEFQPWQIAHFRLTGDDRRLPYGTSFLEKARRIWKQLLLSEDAMLIYRVTRAPERRVYKIFVGNIDDEDVGAYVDKIADRFKRTPVIDPQTGQIDLQYNQLGQDQDIFIPVRDESAATPIDTLPGASNLDQISDIEYLQNKLFTALRVPKPFLGFDDTAGDGKNLAIQDIRFARTINRIQQSILMELNKIAIVHLFLLGFEDDLHNFKLTLNNPSTQAEMLKIENMMQKMSLFRDAVTDLGNGFAAMSMTKGKRDILGWSNEEIKKDLLEQRIEKAAAKELEDTSKIIKHTGIFDKVDNVFGDVDALDARSAGKLSNGDENNEDGGDGGLGGGGGGGGGDFGDFGTDGLDMEDEDNEDFESNDDGDDGADVDNDITLESIKNGQADKLLTDAKRKLIEKSRLRKEQYQNIYFNKLIESIEPTRNIKKTKNVDKQNNKLNMELGNLIKEINQIDKDFE